jgi:hypothetical protein
LNFTWLTFTPGEPRRGFIGADSVNLPPEHAPAHHVPSQDRDRQEDQCGHRHTEGYALRQEHEDVRIVGVDWLTARVDQARPPRDCHQDQRGDKGLQTYPTDQRAIGKSNGEGNQERHRDEEDERRIGNPEACCHGTGQGDHRAHRKVDPAADDDDVHANCDDPDERGRPDHIHDVPKRPKVFGDQSGRYKKDHENDEVATRHEALECPNHSAASASDLPIAFSMIRLRSKSPRS